MEWKLGREVIHQYGIKVFYIVENSYYCVKQVINKRVATFRGVYDEKTVLDL